MGWTNRINICSWRGYHHRAVPDWTNDCTIRTPQVRRRAISSTPPAATGVYIIGGPGENQPVRKVIAHSTAAVAQLVLRKLDQATPIQATVAAPPPAGDYAVQLTLDNGKAITIEPAAYDHRSAMQLRSGEPVPVEAMGRARRPSERDARPLADIPGMGEDLKHS